MNEYKYFTQEEVSLMSNILNGYVKLFTTTEEFMDKMESIGFIVNDVKLVELPDTIFSNIVVQLSTIICMNKYVANQIARHTKRKYNFKREIESLMDFLLQSIMDDHENYNGILEYVLSDIEMEVDAESFTSTGKID